MLEEKAIRGIPWTVLTYAGNRVLTLATMVVLARLLVPSDFGLVALAVLGVGLLSLFSGLGLGGVLIVRQDLDARAQGTVLTLLLVTGAALALLLAAGSPLVADAFDEPRLKSVLGVLSLMVLLSGFNWFYETVMQRELEFRRRFFSQMAQTVANASSALLLAILGAGVWSLVAGQIFGTVAYGVALVSLAPYRVRPAFDRKAARDVLRNGRGFLLQGGTAFVSMNADYVAVGRALGAGPLGIYSMAYRVGEVPYWAIVDPVARVTFPGFARMRHRGEDLRRTFLSSLRLVALVTCPLGVLLSAAASPFTNAVFGETWLAMIGPLAVLGIWTAVRSVEVTTAWLLNSAGEADLLALLSGVLLAPLVVSLLVAAELGGITAVAWVMLANAVLGLVVVGFFVERRVGVSLAEQWRAIWPVVAACPVSWAAARGVAELMEAERAALGLVASVGAGVAAYAAVILAVQPSLPGDAFGQLSRMLGRASVPSST
jgi:PST family polysaccharide transporter